MSFVKFILIKAYKSCMFEILKIGWVANLNVLSNS